MKEQNPSLMPPMFEPVERKLLDAFRARARENEGKDGGVEAAYFDCRDCENAPRWEKTACRRACKLPDSGGYNNDFFGITSCTVK